MRSVIVAAFFVVVAAGVYVAIRRHSSRAPISNEALLHMRVPPDEALERAAIALERIWRRAPTVAPDGLRVCVSTRIDVFSTLGEKVCVVVRPWEGGSALTVRSHSPTVIDEYPKNSRNVRRVAELLVDEGATLRYPL